MPTRRFAGLAGLDFGQDCAYSLGLATPDTLNPMLAEFGF